MSKPQLKSPPLKVKLPELVDCDLCDKGKVEGLLHKMVCNKCDGSGVLNKETGEKLPLDLLIPAMRETINKLKIDKRLLQQELRQYKPKQDPGDPYPENMPIRHGGKHRMD